jgi:hypothetical protein
VFGGESVCFGDDRDDHSFLPESAEDLDLETVVETSFTRRSTINVGIKSRRIEHKEDAMYVGIPKTRTTHHLLLFGECLLKFGLDECGHLSQLKVDNALLQASGVPESEANSLALHLSLNVGRDEVAFGL